MGWMTELSTVYDLVMRDAERADKPLPLYHIENNAPLIITLDGNSRFRAARLLGKNEKKEWQTCMPCTEKSASRTSGVEAYPFCDKLEYVADDYRSYIAGKNLEDKHNQYCSLLEHWAESEYSNQKIKSVYNYVKKGILIADLFQSGIPELSNPTGLQGNNVFVRWEVEIPGDVQCQTWKDAEIQRLWIQFYSKFYLNKHGFCYISGKKEPIAELHPAKIRNSGDSAKIISSNDSSNYTYRGRFESADQACQVGIEVTTKAHNALRWLIGRQGKTIGNGLTVVSWCSTPDVKPELMASSQNLLDDLSDEMEDDTEADAYSTAEDFAHALNSRLLGYYGDISIKDKILVMGLNAATPGRMSILVYREFDKSDFCVAQEYWHVHLAWFYHYWKKEKEVEKPKIIFTISAPSPLDISETAYGVHLNDNVKAMSVQRLLSCILDMSPIPQDIEHLCYNAAVRLITLEKNEREKVLETACAVIKYNAYAEKNKEYKVGLEEDRNTRSYLFGRLLAVADKVEAKVLCKQGEERETNAVRYMPRFAKYPCSTWEFLYAGKLRPYFSRLPKKSRDWYESLIQEINVLFDPNDFVSDKALSGEFLLGYHCQQKAFWDGYAKLKDKKQPEPANDEEKEE